MRQLRLLGRTRDGSALVMEAAGERFVLPVDEAVLAAMGAPVPEPDEPRAPLRPREIQDRIRRGETAAAIAVDAAMDLAEVARYEGPILDERRFQAEQAAGALIGPKPLRDRVAAHGTGEGLRAVDPYRYDAWLEDDGWRVQVVWESGPSATWLWRPEVRSLRPLDRVARLVGGDDSDDLEAVLRPLYAPEPRGDAADDAPMATGSTSLEELRARASARRGGWEEVSSAGTPEGQG